MAGRRSKKFSPPLTLLWQRESTSRKSADTAGYGFFQSTGGWYDIVVVMYHDQGHIPLKLKAFVYNKELKKWDAVAGVNITLGLPIIRASVDHGTGEGHAGDGSANELSLCKCYRLCCSYGCCKNRIRILYGR